MSRVVLALFVLACVTTANTFVQPEEWQQKLEQGNYSRNTGKYKEAIVLYREVIQILDRSGLEPARLIFALNSLAMTYDDLGQLENAEHNYRRALTVSETLYGLHSVPRAQVLVNLSSVYIHREQFAKAETLIREGLAIYYNLLPAENIMIAVARSCLAQALLKQSNYEEAASVADQALTGFAKNPLERAGYYALCLNAKGAILYHQQHPAEAIQLFERSVAEMELERGKDNPQLLYPLNNLAVAREHSGRPEEAAGLLARAMEIARTKLGADHPMYGELLMNYSNCVNAAGDKGEAKKLRLRAAAILKTSSLQTGAGFVVDASSLRAK